MENLENWEKNRTIFQKWKLFIIFLNNSKLKKYLKNSLKFLFSKLLQACPSFSKLFYHFQNFRMSNDKIVVVNHLISF